MNWRTCGSDCGLIKGTMQRLISDTCREGIKELEASKKIKMFLGDKNGRKVQGNWVNKEDLCLSVCCVGCVNNLATLSCIT